MSRKSSGGKSGADSAAADKNSAAIREFQSSCPENKKCFDCDQRGPTYVNMTIGAFVCTKCSGMLRGITPPHRIKSISMSSFSADEVEFLKSRGNVWCGKVWLGLHDNKNRPAGLDLKDNSDDATKDFIIQKYEKKRYYVDPSTIRHTLSSNNNKTESSLASTSSISNHSNSSSAMIGTTLSHRAALSRPNTTTRPHHTTATPIMMGGTKVNGINVPGNSGGLSGIVLPPPVVDPFSNNVQSGFNIPHSKPTSSTAPTTTTTTIKTTTTTTSSSTPSSMSESFANFDAAKFDTAADPLSAAAAAPVVSQQQNRPVMVAATGAAPPPLNVSSSEQKKNEQDRYAALKDLDEIFKSTVVMNEGIGSGTSTGTSLFGTSPIPSVPQQQQQQPSQQQQQQPIMQHQQPLNPSPIVAATTGASPSVFGAPAAPTAAATVNGFATNWASVEQAKPTNSGWAAWPSTSPQQQQQQPMTGPINPFTGASNLTQLNTSPWPTTGTSPVQSSAMAWPPMASANNANTSSTNTDPFSAAPTSHLHQSENNNDLFAKAPKPFGTDSSAVVAPIPDDNVISALTKEIFGNVSSASSTANGTTDLFNPWATPPAAGQNLFTSSMKPASNSKNPFL